MNTEERDMLINAAQGRLCELGGDDHGHADCWIIGGLLSMVSDTRSERAERPEGAVESPDTPTSERPKCERCGGSGFVEYIGQFSDTYHCHECDACASATPEHHLDAKALLIESMSWNWAGVNDSIVEELIEPVLAEIDRLTALLAEAETAAEQALADRDRCEGWADALAYAIAPIEQIGEHSSLNNPWENAIAALAERDATIAELREYVTPPPGAARAVAALRTRLAKSDWIVCSEAETILATYLPSASSEETP